MFHRKFDLYCTNSFHCNDKHCDFVINIAIIYEGHPKNNESC